MSESILEIDGLSKHFRSQWTYKKIEAVRNLSLQVESGESFGFLGHNGAGKTTTIKCILGLIKKTSGEIRIAGKPLLEAKERSSIGYLPEQPYFYDHLSVLETLAFFAELYGLRGRAKRTSVSDAIELVGLGDRAHDPVRTLSKGLQQRLGFAQATMNHPSLLFLDEPFSGLDPGGRSRMRDWILDLERRGTTIFLSSHILSDVESISNRVAIMSGGELKRVFKLADVPRLFGEEFELLLESSPKDSALMRKLETLSARIPSDAAPDGGPRRFAFENYDRAREALSTALSGNVRILDFRVKAKSLEEIFLGITAEANRRESEK